MYLHRFYVGVGLDLNNKAMKSIDIKAMAVEEALSEEFGGCTVYDALGCWKDDKNLVTEPCKVFEIMTATEQVGLRQAFGVRLKNVFQQKSILYTCHEVQSEFI